MKKVIITLCASIMILAFSTIIFIINKNDNKHKIEMAKDMYSKIDSLYSFNNGLEYVTNDDKKINTIQRGDKIYYQIEDYKTVTNEIMTEKMTQKFTNIVNIVEDDGKYYIENMGRGSNGFIGLIFKIKAKSSKKISLIVKTKFCEIEHRVEHGDGCESEEYLYTIDKPFILVKENGKWKVDEYTSIFEFDDSEIK